MFARVFCLKPELFGRDVNQPFGGTLEPQGFDASVFEVFFALGAFQLGVKGHSRAALLNGMAVGTKATVSAVLFVTAV